MICKFFVPILALNLVLNTLLCHNVLAAPSLPPPPASVAGSPSAKKAPPPAPQASAPASNAQAPKVQMAPALPQIATSASAAQPSAPSSASAPSVAPSSAVAPAAAPVAAPLAKPAKKNIKAIRAAEKAKKAKLEMLAAKKAERRARLTAQKAAVAAAGEESSAEGQSTSSPFSHKTAHSRSEKLDNTDATNAQIFTSEYKDLYFVENIKVEKAAKTPSAAKNIAIASAVRFALKVVVKRLDEEADPKLLSDSEIEKSVDSIQITDEKSFGNNYSAIITVGFIENETIPLLSVAQERQVAKNALSSQSLPSAPQEPMPPTDRVTFGLDAPSNPAKLSSASAFNPAESLRINVPITSLDNWIEVKSRLRKAGVKFKIYAYTNKRVIIDMKDAADKFDYFAEVLTKQGLDLSQKDNKHYLYIR